MQPVLLGIRCKQDRHRLNQPKLTPERRMPPCGLSLPWLPLSSDGLAGLAKDTRNLPNLGCSMSFSARYALHDRHASALAGYIA